MASNIWFNVCALFVLTALLVVYYTKFNAPFQKYNIFLWLVWCAEISTIASLCNNVLPGYVPNWVLRTSNTTYFFAHSLIPPALMLYVYSLTDNSLTNWQRLIPWLIPSAFSLLLIITSWYSDGLFWLDEGGIYHRGPLMPLLYLITVYNFIGILFILYKNWRLIPRMEGISVLIFLGLSSGAVIIQLFFPWLLVENFASAMCMMISQLTVQNPELILDGGSGMLNKQGFSNLVSPLFERKRPFQMGFLMVDNYHELEKVYGFTRLESRIRILTDLLKQHSGSIFSRLDNRLFCFVPEGFQNGSGWSSLLRDLEEETLVSNLREERIGVHLQLKIGILNCPQEIDSFGSMMELIDVASQMPMSKSQDVLRLSPVDVMKLQRRKQIAELVRSAVKDNSLFLMYQPVYGIQEGRFCSAEALLRMNTEKLGFISPAEFIPIAEDNGAILQLTRFVVETACNFIRNSNMKALNLRRIHINLSAIDCAQNDLAARILDVVQKSGIEHGMLSAEITETAFSSMPDSILSNLTDLSEAGISIMLDDYGTGYSNLNRLYSMPLDVVKLDKSLVDHVLTSESARIVLENTILMMKRLNKKILVEGVETKEQADYLISLGVNYIQGYYYARPMDSIHLEELFRAQAEKLTTL